MTVLRGATPLAALDAVAVDTETTGLDTAKDRIVQIAGVEIELGRIVAETGFNELVAPGVPIPPASSAIHGITDEAVSGAPAIADLLPRLRDFVGSRLLIGYSIGFDLAVLQNEAARAGIEWHRPRSLCVRLLGSIVVRHLPEESLDALAGWLGVTISGRHRADGDARAAAEVFLALLPHLAERGIRTLAEAERACLSLSGHLDAAHRAGWSEPVTRPDLALATGAVDPYAYSHRIRDLMTSPPAVIADTVTIREAVREMTSRRISSVLVSADGRPGGPLDAYGIVTERDIMRLVATHDAAALAMTVGEIATRPLASVAGGAFVYRAIGRMDRLRLRHLAVRDEQERLAGMISARDLLRLRAGSAITLDDAIGAAATPREMARAWAQLPVVARNLVAEELDARTVAGVISEEIRIMTRRAAELANQAMAEAGRGGPPCRYALMVLGSGGRGESLLAADQDNAIVYATGAPDGPEDRWFAELGAHIAETLDAAGIPFCNGGVMAKNPPWRGSLETWRERVLHWVGRSRPEDLLNVDIFYDQRPVHGDLELGAELFGLAYEVGAANPVFAKLLGEKLFQPSNTFTMLGGIRTEDGRIDMKRHGLFPIVGAARALAIRHGIRERSTRGRLEGLIAAGIGNVDEMARLIEAHRLYLTLMLEQQSQDLETGIPVSNKVEVGGLPKAVISDLKAALHATRTVPEMVRALMFA